MAITDIRVVQVWDIDEEGKNIPITHYFQVQRNNEEAWEQLEVVNALRTDHRKKDVEGDDIYAGA